MKLLTLAIIFFSAPVGATQYKYLGTSGVADGSITTAKIASDAVTSTKLYAGCAEGEIYKIVSGVWACGADAGAAGGIGNVVEDLTPQLGGPLDMNDKRIDGQTTFTSSVTVKTTSLFVGAMTIPDSTVTTAKLESDSVTTAKILDGSVTPAKLDRSYSEGAHTTDTSADTICSGTGNYLDGEGNCDALVTDTGAPHGDGANCSAGNYPLGVDANGAVESCTADADTFVTNKDSHDHIGGDGAAIAEGAISDGAIATAKLATDSVIEAKILNGAVTTSKLHDEALMDASKPASVSTLEIADSLVIGVGGTISHTISGVEIDSLIEAHSEGGTAPGGLTVHRHSDTQILGAQILGMKSRGSHTSPTIIADDDILSWIAGIGYDGTDYESAGAIRFEIDGTPGNNDMPGRIVFLVTPDGGVSPVEAVRIAENGNVGIGDTTPDATLDVVGDVIITSTLTVSEQLAMETYKETITDHGSAGASLTVDWDSQSVSSMTLSANLTLSFAGAEAGQSLTTFMFQDATGSRTVTWPAGVAWAGGSAPTLTTTAGKLDVFSFFYDGNIYYGFVGGQNF